MADFILAIDQGTTGSTALLIDKNGKVCAKVNEEFRQIYPQPAWVEHNPDDIWQSVESTVRQVLSKASIEAQDIAAIGITNQRETVALWNPENGRPLHNAIVWQDRRTASFCEKLKKNKKEKIIQQKTGLVIDPYFSASKMNWLLKNVDGLKNQAKQGLALFGNIDTYLLWKLTGGESFKTDVSNASRTQLMNITTGDWDKDLLKLFGVPRTMLPEISPSSGEFGRTKGLSFLPDGIPISGIAGDQQAALFGQTCFDVGQAKCTYGTGSFILINSGKEPTRSKNGLLTTIAWQLGPDKPMVYALEGGAFICGAAVQWLRDGLGLLEKSSDIEGLAAQVESSEGVEFVPALTGLGAPHWDAEARGLLCGLTRGTTKSHIARSTLESMALQNVDILLAMQKDIGKKLKDLRVDGGASSNNLLMQIQADYLGVGIERPEVIETTSIGAAYLAGLGVGFWQDLNEIRSIWRVEKDFASQISSRDRTKRMESWNSAIQRTTMKPRKPPIAKRVKPKPSQRKSTKRRPTRSTKSRKVRN